MDPHTASAIPVRGRRKEPTSQRSVAQRAGIEPATSCLQSGRFSALYLGLFTIVFNLVFNYRQHL